MKLPYLLLASILSVIHSSPPQKYTCEEFDFKAAGANNVFQSNQNLGILPGDRIVTPVTVTETDINSIPVGSAGGFICTVLVPGAPPNFLTNQTQSCLGDLNTGSGSLFFRGIGNAVDLNGIDIAIVGGTGPFLGAYGQAKGIELDGGNFSTFSGQFIGTLCTMDS